MIKAQLIMFLKQFFLTNLSTETPCNKVQNLKIFIKMNANSVLITKPALSCLN